MTVHELKDLAMIYHDSDDYKVVVWDPVQQKTYDLVFTGSSNTEKTISFNIHEVAHTDKEKRRIELLNELIMLSREQYYNTKRYTELKEEFDKLDNEQ